MHFLVLEAYYGGSHKAFLDGLIPCIPGTADVRTLPARHWKWRMRSSALHFLRLAGDISAYDGIVTTNMTAVAELKGLAGPLCPPVFLYFHENQFDYPLSPRSDADLHPAMTDLTSALAADVVAFNSHSHRERFFHAAAAVLRRFPKPRLLWTLESVRRKSGVLYPGCDLASFEESEKHATERPFCVVWNHRWEHDKNPGDFFDALQAMKADRIPFRLMLLGARGREVPEIFARGIQALSGHLLYRDYPETREAYAACLKQGHIAISTAVQENFGMSVVESMAAGCVPLLPDRLSYPEILPPCFHGDLLYKDLSSLKNRLVRLLMAMPEDLETYRRLLVPWSRRFDWEARGQAFSKALEQMVLEGGQKNSFIFS